MALKRVFLRVARRFQVIGHVKNIKATVNLLIFFLSKSYTIPLIDVSRVGIAMIITAKKRTIKAQ